MVEVIYNGAIEVSESAFEKDSQGGFGVIHRASDQRREPTPDAEKEAACEAALRYRSDRLPRDNQGETAASIRMRMRRGWTDGARA